MSNLYASIQSDSGKGRTTRTGNKAITAHVRGWDVGVLVQADYTPEGPTIDIWITNGSNDDARTEFLGTAFIGPDGKPAFLKFQPTKE